MAEPGMARRRFRRDLVSRTWGHISGVRGTFFGLAALSVVTAQAESVALILIALIADTVARGSARTRVEIGPVEFDLATSAAASLAAAAILIAALVVYAYGSLWAKTYAQLERRSRDEIVSSFAGADWAYQATQKSSQLQGRLLRLMDARATAFSGLVGWARASTTILVFVGAATVLSPLGAVVIVAFAAILSLAVLPMRRRTVRLAARAAHEEVSLAGDVAEAADHGADVHVFGAWPAFVSRFTTRSRALETVRRQLGTLRYLIPMAYQYGAFALILLILLIASGPGASSGFGQFAASALLLLRSVQYGQQLQASLQTVAEAVPRVELLNRELLIPEPRKIPGDRTLPSIEAIDLRGITYQYPGSSTAALQDVSLSLRPGTILGVAGPSGSGKTTLAQVLLRLRWPSAGEYLVNGRPAEDYSPESWRRLVSYVPQQPRLLHGSLAENVSFLDESISSDRVAESLSAVGLQHLDRSLRRDTDGDLGPSSRNLSGGQIQRVGIARALARKPRMVILDEPTSALDVNAERVVVETLIGLRGQSDVLVVVIAHRTSTLAMCDEIVVLNQGQVVARGRSEKVLQHIDVLTGPGGQSAGGSDGFVVDTFSETPSARHRRESPQG